MAKFTITKIDHFQNWLQFFNTKVKTPAKHWSQEPAEPDKQQVNNSNQQLTEIAKKGNTKLSTNQR